MFLWRVIGEILCVFTGAYIVLVVFWSVGWALKRGPKLKGLQLPFISTIVPFRNESYNLERCSPLQSVGTYPTNRVEYIYVDDHSEDTGPEQVVDLMHGHPDLDVELFSLSTTEGKKQALTRGIRQAKGQIIATLDADTLVGPRWLHHIAQGFADDAALMLILPVAYEKEKNVFQHCLSLEFMSLVATGMASAKMRLPLMANGANLAFRKEAWLAANGYQSNVHIPSGDDMFLMLAIDKLVHGSVHVVQEKEALAHTAPPANFAAFIRQRIRWAGKTPALKSLWPMNVAAVVMGWNVVALVVAVWACFTPSLWVPLAWCFGIKFLADALFLVQVAGFFGKRHVLWTLPFVTLAYPFYVVGIGLASLFVKPKWKQRKLEL